MRFWWKAAAPTQTANEKSIWALAPPGSYPVSFDRGAKINRRATELQIMAGGKGLGASDAVIAIATALGNEVAAMVIRHPSLTIEEMLELVCQSVREVAHIAAGSSHSPKADDAKELTEQEFKELTMRVVHIATENTLPTDAMAAIAKALGTLIGVTAQRPDCDFEDLLRWAQNALVAFARDARDAAT